MVIDDQKTENRAEMQGENRMKNADFSQFFTKFQQGKLPKDKKMLA
ncbi:MAG: hypothetical protein IKD35_00480 [Clostridia bacterium]|nr:hypothetical protein [Clostridia bacterium]